MKPIVVLISGKQGSGKTTTINGIVSALSERFMGKFHIRTANFADTIYQIHDFARGQLAMLGVPVDLNKKDGKLLQLLGTEWGRNTLDEDVWVNCLKGRILNISNAISEKDSLTQQLFLVGDCRFKNELSVFSESFKVRLECDREVRKARCSSWRDNDTHQSEIDLDNCEDKFDLLIDSGKYGINHCVELIVAQILKRSTEL